MKATVYLANPATGQILAARLVEVVMGRITAASFAPAVNGNGTMTYEAALDRTGLRGHISLDLGLGVARWRTMQTRGFGWGGSKQPPPV